jgi:hypothetical protein
MTTHIQPYNALEGFSGNKLTTFADIQPLDALEVRENVTSQLTAAPQAQTVNPLEVHKSGGSDGVLVAVSHIQGMNAFEVHKSGISDSGLATVFHF